MPIKVVNSDSGLEIPKEEESEILTSDYIRQVSEGIAFRIRQRQMALQYIPEAEEEMKRKLLR